MGEKAERRAGVRSPGQGGSKRNEDGVLLFRQRRAHGCTREKRKIETKVIKRGKKQALRVRRGEGRKLSSVGSRNERGVDQKHSFDLLYVFQRRYGRKGAARQ